MSIDKVLEIINRLQKKYPRLHVGGSIGLLLHGIDLGRTKYKDIDFCTDADLFDSIMDKNWISGNDFDYKKTVNGIDYEIRIDGSQTFVAKAFKGKYYNVSELKTIVMYKESYMNKGYQKHKDDLKIIYQHIGEPVVNALSDTFDDLPF